MTIKADDGNGGTATIAVTINLTDVNEGTPPSTAHCNPMDTNELWCSNLTVGTLSSGEVTAHGYNRGLSYGALAPDSFDYRTATIGVDALAHAGGLMRFDISHSSGTTPADGLLGTRNFSLEIGTGAAKRSFSINNPGTGLQFPFSNHGLSWSVDDTVPVKLVRTNTAPTVAAVIPDQTATAATAFSYAFPDTTFSDADGDTLTYTATQADGTALPSWLSFSTSTRTFSGTPQAADVATVSVKVTASDGSASVSDTFDIVVSAAGDTTAPTLTSAVVNETGQLIQLRFSENVDRSNLTPASAVTVTAGASPLTITGVTVPPPAGGLDLYRVLVTPAIRQGQAVIVTYTDPTAGNDANAIQDTAGNDAASFTTGSDGVPAVTNGSTLTNTAPTVAAVIPDQTATAATAFSYAFPDTTFSDADGDTLTYTATQADGTALPSWLSFSTSTRTFSGTPQTADVATVSVKVTASDGSASVSDTFDIVVSAAGDTTAPTLTSAVVNETGQLIQLRFSENVDRSNLTPASAVTVTAGASPLTITGVTVPPPAGGLDKYRVLVTPRSARARPSSSPTPTPPPATTRTPSRTPPATTPLPSRPARTASPP